MNTYKIMNEAIQSKDLLYSGQKLIEFADAARLYPSGRQSSV